MLAKYKICCSSFLKPLARTSVFGGSSSNIIKTDENSKFRGKRNVMLSTLKHLCTNKINVHMIIFSISQFSLQIRSDWRTAKLDIMYRALKCKFSSYPHLKSMLLSTAGSVLVEASPHDLFWGGGRDGEGLNYLGRLLMQLRAEFLGQSSTPNGSSTEFN